jgi:hypothetical protein
VHILVVRGEHQRIIRREVDTLAERDRVPGFVEFEPEDEHVRVAFKLGLLRRCGNRQGQHANNQDNEGQSPHRVSFASTPPGVNRNTVMLDVAERR